MRTLVCGDRHWTDREIVYGFLSTIPITLLIEGEARGADRISCDYARDNNLPCAPYPANWEKYHRGAGHIRNKQMLNANPELVIAFHPDIASSRGTRNMVEQSLRAGKDVIIVSSESVTYV